MENRRLIDLDKIKPIDFPSTEMDGLDVVRYLNTLPTVDAVEVVHGRWEPHPRHPEFDRCSACCNCIIGDDWADDEKWNYCPNCGAKMDGECNG